MATEQIKYPYPSRYGSHNTMTTDVAIDKVDDTLPDEIVICKDERGLYMTIPENLDNGMADPYRVANTNWREQTLSKVQFTPIVEALEAV